MTVADHLPARAPLTDEEKAAALVLGQYGANVVEKLKWGDFCRAVKAARLPSEDGDQYPIDWFPLIVQGKLFADNGQALMRRTAFTVGTLRPDDIEP